MNAVHHEVLRSVSAKLTKREPPIIGPLKAAVSIIFREADSKVLLIKRAERDGDPWSGQIAFPGGKSKAGDSSARVTAARETKEEVGIDLDETAEFLGYFTPFRTHTGNMEVIPAVFLLLRPGEVRVNQEVSSYKWVDLAAAKAESASASYSIDAPGGSRDVRAFRVEEYLIWGLTHRIMTSLAS